jgi:hypothetical protein
VDTERSPTDCRYIDTGLCTFLATAVLPLTYVNQQKVVLAGGDYQLASTINIHGNMVTRMHGKCDSHMEGAIHGISFPCLSIITEL